MVAAKWTCAVSTALAVLMAVGFWLIAPADAKTPGAVLERLRNDRATWSYDTAAQVPAGWVPTWTVDAGTDVRVTMPGGSHGLGAATVRVDMALTPRTRVPTTCGRTGVATTPWDGGTGWPDLDEPLTCDDGWSVQVRSDRLYAWRG